MLNFEHIDNGFRESMLGADALAIDSHQVIEIVDFEARHQKKERSAIFYGAIRFLMELKQKRSKASRSQ